MTSRIAIAAIVAACLFGVGYALAEPPTRPTGAGVASDVAPERIALQPVSVEAGLRGGTPAQLRPAPVRRSRRAASSSPPSRTAAPGRTTRPAPPRVVAPPAPRPVSTPAPRQTTPPASRQKPAPKPPSYVGSGFDDSG